MRETRVMPNPTSPRIELSELKKSLLVKISRAHTSSIREVERSSMILTMSEGLGNKPAAAKTGFSIYQFRLWRARWLSLLSGLVKGSRLKLKLFSYLKIVPLVLFCCSAILTKISHVPKFFNELFQYPKTCGFIVCQNINGVEIVFVREDLGNALHIAHRIVQYRPPCRVVIDAHTQKVVFTAFY